MLIAKFISNRVKFLSPNEPCSWNVLQTHGQTEARVLKCAQQAMQTLIFNYSCMVTGVTCALVTFVKMKLL